MGQYWRSSDKLLVAWSRPFEAKTLGLKNLLRANTYRLDAHPVCAQEALSGLRRRCGIRLWFHGWVRLRYQMEVLPRGRIPCGDGNWERAGHWHSTMITPRRFDRLPVINALDHQEAMGTYSRNLSVAHTTSWVSRSGQVKEAGVTMGVVISLGHSWRHLRFRQAHTRICGGVILRPHIVQLRVGSAFGL